MARKLAILFLLGLIVAAQASAFTVEQRAHPSDHCCVLCHAGPLPFLNSSMVVALAPVLAPAWLGHPADFEPVHRVPVAPLASRAPPE
jgi:hypothetical protein